MLYDIALSYSSNDFAYVDLVAQTLIQSGLKVFYDRHNEVRLWGTDLKAELSAVYSTDSEYCAIFWSASYSIGRWTMLEWEAALQGQKHRAPYILPVKLDDSKAPETFLGIGLVDGRNRTPEQLAEMICTRIDSLRTKSQEHNHGSGERDILLVKDGIIALAETAINGRVEIALLAKSLRIARADLEKTLLKMYHLGFVRYHPGDRVSDATRGV